MIKCKTCGEEKEDYWFYTRQRPNGTWYIYKICNKCRYKRGKKTRDRRAEKLRQKYKLTKQKYNKIRDHQNRKCAICNNDPLTKHLYVDHNHTNHQIRGLLCVKCNLGLGKSKDNIEILKKAIKYLERYQ